jgi:hypothetical protein
MSADGRFSAQTVATLAKRGGMLCSNPDCRALTSGPTIEATGSVNLGEAAHIYGRARTSARYYKGLTSTELSDITNGIWLCNTCHKLIDSDSLRFPVDLLFEWRRQHEADVMSRLGKPGDQAREKIRQKHLSSFENLSYLAQQIILDRPKLWEWKLAVEVLRTELGPVQTRWDQLKRGLYVQRSTIIRDEEWSRWLSAKINDTSKITQSLPLLATELTKSFGPPGTPGDDVAIVNTSRLIVAVATNFLNWEEEIRFAFVPEEFREALAALQGFSGNQLEQIFRIPTEISRFLAIENPTGDYMINLTLTVPEGMVETFGKAIQRGAADFARRRSSDLIH